MVQFLWEHARQGKAPMQRSQPGCPEQDAVGIDAVMKDFLSFVAFALGSKMSASNPYSMDKTDVVQVPFGRHQGMARSPSCNAPVVGLLCRSSLCVVRS